MGVIRKKTATRGGEGGVKYICDVCSADVTSTVRIRCAHSACHEYDLCVMCFGKGLTSQNHQPASHPFRVIEQNSVPIYDETWGADEELLLLEGAEIYGLGSWTDIANHIGGYRSKDEVEAHYNKIYLESPNFPLPKRAAPDDMELLEQMPREEFQIAKKRRIETRKEESKNAAPATPKAKPTASVPSCHEVQGYMPGRLEFETEHFNDAEEAVMHMSFDPGDGLNPLTGQMEPEMELKMTVMDIYNKRLDGRLERKKIIFEHGLLEYKKNAALDKKRTKEERDLLNKAKPFARMMNHDDFDSLCAGLINELNLRQAISQLQEWRKNGIGDLRAGEKFEAEKVLRLQKQVPMGSLDRERFATQRGKAALFPDTPSGAAALIAPELPLRFQLGLGGLGSAIGSGIGTPNGVSPPAAGKANGTLTPISNKKKDQAAALSITPISGITPLTTLSSKPTTASGREKENEPEIPWTDAQLLTPQEIDLCKVIRMHPKPYLALKEIVVKEGLKVDGKLKKKAVREIWVRGLEGGKGGRVWDAFVGWGWIGKA